MLEKFKEWCRLTKRCGSILIGSSIKELLAHLEQQHVASEMELKSIIQKCIVDSKYLVPTGTRKLVVHPGDATDAIIAKMKELKLII